MKIEWAIVLTEFRCRTCGKVWAQEGVEAARCPHCAANEIRCLRAEADLRVTNHSEFYRKTTRRIAALKGAITKLRRKLNP